MTRKSETIAPYAVGRQLAALRRPARKSLGQHFLNSAPIAERIVDLAQLSGQETVVEIGPGLGALSELLAERCKHLSLIEIDRDLAEKLRQRFADDERVHLIEANALNVDFQEVVPEPPAIAVANLPYNIATAVIARMTASGVFARMILMVQLEVARRMTAHPGSKDYGVLSIFTQLDTEVSIGLKVGPGAFVPPPKVDSAVVVVIPRAAPAVSIVDRPTFDRLVRAIFTQRRKQLLNSLKQLTPQSAAVLSQAGIDPRRRPETLSLAELAVLANALADLSA